MKVGADNGVCQEQRSDKTVVVLIFISKTLRRNNMKKLLAFALVLVMCIACLAACTNNNSNGTDDTTNGSSEGTQTFVLGGIGPLTGGAAIYGNNAKNGAEIAVEEINAADSAINFTLLYEDDEHDAEKSVNAYNSLKDKGLQVLVGTVTSTPAIAVSAETFADRVFMLTPSASSTDVLGGFEDADGNISIARKDNVFQICFTDPNQGVASADFIAENEIATKVAVIYKNDDAYSTGVFAKFEEEAAAKNLEIVYTGTFTENTANDFNTQLTGAKTAGADLIFLPIYYQPASLILEQADSMGYDPVFFGIDGMDGILTMEGFDTSLAEGVLLLTPFSADEESEATKNFVAKYEEKFGETPNQFAADGYDTVYVIYQAIKEGNLTADMSASELCEKLIEIITSPDFVFDGVTATGAKWSTTGEVSKDPKAVVIENGVYVSYSK